MPVKPYNIEQSREMLHRSDQLIVRGCQGHKRSHEMLELGYPVFTQRASGARFWDVDGNEYLDYLMGFGPIVLGHNDPAVNAAVLAQMEEGTIYSTAHPKELEVAEMLIDLIPAVEMLGFLIGGSAATSAAVRLARAYTGRDKVIPLRLSRLARLVAHRRRRLAGRGRAPHTGSPLRGPRCPGRLLQAE